MTKRLICVFGALLLACSPALAVFRGVLSSSQLTSITLTDGAGNLGPASATIYMLGKGFTVETLTAQIGMAAQFQVNLAKSTTRVIVEVDVPNAGGSVFIQVTQANGTNFSDQVTQDTRFVYDVQ
jgi:hypothetical protein